MQAYGEHKDCQLTDFCELGLLGRCPQTKSVPNSLEILSRFTEQLQVFSKTVLILVRYCPRQHN